MKDMSISRRQGDVVPFTRSTDYWHRRAMDNRRSLRFPEAVELLRSAARQEPDNVEIQMDLAETLSEMECFEQSSRLLYRLLSQDPNMAECYYGLACNDYGMQKNEEALDALVHYLRLAPEGPYAEEARDMLEMLSEVDFGGGNSRGELLIRRGMKAFADDKPHKATEHLKRALRVTREETRVRTMLSLSLLSEGKPKEALRHAMAACRRDKQSVQARCSLCCALWMLKKPRAAAGLLQEAAKWCESPYEELLFCHTASQLNQRELLLKFLQARSQWTPFRTGTLHSLAVAYYNLGHYQKAKALWLRVMQIDPENLLAEYGNSLCQKALNGEAAGKQTLGYHPILPREENQRRLQLIAAALSGGEDVLKDRWRRDDTLKKMIRWAFTLPDDRLQGALLGVLAAVGPEAAVLVKELLTDDTMSEELKRRAVLLLNRMGEPMPYVLTYQRRITQVQCIPKEFRGVPQWRSFLKLFLQETGHWGNSREAAFFAAELYRSLPRAMREEASGDKSLQWVKAFEIMFLYQEGRLKDMEAVARELPISIRHIQRVIRMIQRVHPRALYPGKGENS
jgi:tetratricopeptide (TPR) repeat protein